MQIVTHATPASVARRLAGGKGGNLHKLSAAGFDVPRWAVLGTDVFDRVLGTGLRERLMELLDGLSAETAAATAEAAARLLRDAELDEEVVSLIEKAYAQVGGGRVAVRSSGGQEDGPSLSYAGQFTTKLGVTGADGVVAAVRECWASAFCERALGYRLRHGVRPEAGGMAVVVQEMVEADKSGVLFTVNPAAGGADSGVLSALYGLGESLVSGQVDADTMVLDRGSGEVTSLTVGEKETRLDAGGTGCAVSDVPAADRERAVLSEEEIARVWAAGMRAEREFGCAQDVEWAIAGRRLWLLQSRPVTSPTDDRAPRTEAEGLRIWDNSNIIESYSDITAPLTYSFAHHVYHRVYVEYARLLRIPDAEMRQMEPWLANMLGYFHGRVYYNLLNWYKIIRLLPGYRLNRKVLEVSMGLQEPLDDDLAATVEPFVSATPGRQRRVRAMIALRFTRYLLRTQRTVRDFLKEFYAAYEEFDGVAYDRLPADEVFRRFERLEARLLARWGPMVLLEGVIAVSFGALLVLTRRWLPEAPGWFYWAVANPGQSVESLQPARRLHDLAVAANADPALERLVRETDADGLADALAAGGHADFLARIDSYIDEFGYRNLNELKLEEPDLREDPTGLYQMLKDALRTAGDGPDEPQAPGEDPDGYLRDRLRGPRRRVYELVRRKVRNSLRARERVRFCRTRSFGMARSMFRAIGGDLARMGAIDAPRDIFWLRLEELRGCFSGTLSHTELKPLIELRKRQAEENSALVPPARFATYGAVYWNGNLERAGWSAARAADAGDADGFELRGTPCGPGTAEGVAQVVDDPRQAAEGILITYRTDPGWIAALTSARALLIERGSPLTHVAIVARELGIPTVVQIRDLTARVATGMHLHVDGSAGVVRVRKREG